MPAALSDRILKEARAQQEEIDAEKAPGGGGVAAGGRLAAAAAALHDSDSEEEEDDLDGLSDGGFDLAGGLEEEEVSPEDEAVLAAFLAPGAADYRQKTLSELVMERIRERQGEQGLVELPR